MVMVPVSCGVVKPVTDPNGMQDAVQVNVVPSTSDNSVASKADAEQTDGGAVLVRCATG